MRLMGEEYKATRESVKPIALSKDTNYKC